MPLSGTVVRVALALLAIFALSVASVEFAPPGVEVAAWWPAAGLSVLLATRFRGHGLWLIFAALMVVTLLANITAGLEPAVAVGFGLANAVESVVGARLLRERGGRLVGLDSLRGLGRILVTALACGSIAAIIAGITIGVLLGGDFLRIVSSVLPAHAAAVLLITPLGLRVMDGAHRAGRAEAVAQWALVLAAVGVVFGLHHNLPTAFVPYVFLVWGAVRLSMRSFQVQLIVVGLSVAVLSAVGRGPFGGGSIAAVESASLVQGYLLTSASVFYVLAVLVGAQRQFATALGSSEELFRESFNNATIGMIIATHGDEGLRVARANSVAIDILQLADGSASDPARVFTERARVAFAGATSRDRQGDPAGWRGQLETREGKVVDVFVAPLTSAGSDRRFAIQFADVSEKALAERALMRAVEYERNAGARLRYLDSMKNSLISSVSHELRTPLAGILGYSEMLLDGDAGPLTVEQAQMITIVERSGQRLSRIVEDLLTMSRIETSTSRAETEWLDPVPVTQAAGAELRPLAEAKRQQLTLQVPESTTEGIAAVPDDIHKIMVNLIANAIKYTPDGGSIEVGVRTADDMMHLDVIDNGIGIAAEDHQRVFGQFYRTNTGDDAPAGTGLGLAIVDALVRRNRGTITVDSAIGRGTRMTVSFALEHDTSFSEPEVTGFPPPAGQVGQRTV